MDQTDIHQLHDYILILCVEFIEKISLDLYDFTLRGDFQETNYSEIRDMSVLLNQLIYNLRLDIASERVTSW